MSRIVLVRHGQASFLQANYDHLCANGELQSRLLGEYWARRGARFNRAWAGPCARQLQTGRMVEEAYRGFRVQFPELTVAEEFDEYPGEAVWRTGLPRLLNTSKEVRDLYQAFQHAADSSEQRRNFQRVYEVVIGKWMSGELLLPDIETWQDFCARVSGGLAKIVNEGSGNFVVFTSGGPIGAAMRHALNLSDADTLQLTFMSYNASFSEFISSGDRFTLSAFNAHPHLDEAALLTYR